MLFYISFENKYHHLYILYIKQHSRSIRFLSKSTSCTCFGKLSKLFFFYIAPFLSPLAPDIEPRKIQLLLLCKQLRDVSEQLLTTVDAKSLYM